MHRSDYLGGQGGARVGCQPDYPDPTADEHDPPMELLACGCSLQNCQQCVNPCDDWDKILADLDENHGRYKTIFRLYGFAANGQPAMGKKQFLDFCEARNITDNSGVSFYETQASSPPLLVISGSIKLRHVFSNHCPGACLDSALRTRFFILFSTVLSCF